MNLRLSDIPIKRKLTGVNLLTSIAGLLTATLALFLFQVITFRQGFVNDLDVMSRIIATQSTASLDFDDAQIAKMNLVALAAKPNIVSALIRNKKGEEFARFGREQDRFANLPSEGYAIEGDDLVYVRPIISNADRVGTLYLRAEYRKAFNQLVRGHMSILAVVLAASILLTLALSTRLQRVISEPILGLADTAKRVAENKDYATRAAELGGDEIGLLTSAFNQMLAQIQAQDAALQSARDQLQERVKALQHEIAERERAERQLEIAHRELLEASRRAGMAEVATGVLHNVGNVLNSVNVSSTLLRDLTRKSEVATLHKLAALLRQHQDSLAAFLADDPRGRQVPELIAKLGEQLSQERSSFQSELDSLIKNVDHIKTIVAMQQSYASVAGFVERVELDRLVEDALEINSAALERHGVKVIRQFESVPPVFLDKHKVLQVLVNLIQNAKYALGESGRSDRQLTMAVRLNSERAAEIIVRDNGVGIPAENLTRIFAHGFTTRKKGHGFGLHASALAARDMGGSLKAQSDGPGLGATFVLTLPLFTKETRHELAP